MVEEDRYTPDDDLLMDRPPPPRDDSWWQVVMSEEEKTRPVRKGFAPAKPSQDPAALAKWEDVLAMQQSEERLDCKVTGFNRGGLLVEADEFQGFVPISHLVDLSAVEIKEGRDAFLSAYIDKTLQLKVIECDPERGRVVLSERAALTDPDERRRLLEGLQVGGNASGVVTNLTSFGAFIDLGGIEGLVHISEISWGRVQHPGDVLALGETIHVQVLQIDSQRNRVSLSIKQLRPNPWKTVKERYVPGEIVSVQITDIMPYGAFARIEEGLEGLIHVSEMGAAGGLAPSDILQTGDQVQVRILQIDSVRQRLSLRLES
jgi:small subunit ribosomal protein S1